LLQNCERLFDNEIEQTAFEDQMRFMFGIKDAFKIFTIDKLIGVIIKQVQLVFTDTKSQDLLEILKRDRGMASSTMQDQINNRRSAEKVLGPDENLFRIDWLTEPKCLTVQLIGKDDSSYTDSEVLTGRWQAYIDSYVANTSTEGVAQQKAKKPFLTRNLPKSLPEPDVIGCDALEIKICVRTYRLFYVSHTEDYLCAMKNKEDCAAILPALEKRQLARKLWIERVEQQQEISQTTDAITSETASASQPVAETVLEQAPERQSDESPPPAQNTGP